MTEPEQYLEFDRKVNALINQMVEHCPGDQPATQVMASWICNDGKTGFLYSGSGNLYARVGMAREFLDRDTASTNVSIEDGGEDPEDSDD